MIALFTTPTTSPVIIALTVLLFITSSITVFDKRLIQFKRSGKVPRDESLLPNWVGAILFLHWIIFISLILLNWKYAIILFVIKYILSVLPVLETIGNVLMSPFKKYVKKEDREKML